MVTRQGWRGSYSPDVGRLDRRIHNPVQRDWMTFSETAQQSRGRRSVFVLELAPGATMAAHAHRAFDERFEVLVGELRLTLGGETRTLRRGDSTVVPRGTPHAVVNPGAGSSEIRVDLTPGHAGFERALRILYGLAQDGRSGGDGLPRSILHLAVVAAMGDTIFHDREGRPRPLLGLLAKVARALGVERALLARYCGGIG